MINGCENNEQTKAQAIRFSPAGVSYTKTVLCMLMTSVCDSGFHRRSRDSLGHGGGSEADPDVSRIKTLKHPVHHDIWKIYKAKVLICAGKEVYILFVFTDRHEADNIHRVFNSF